VYLRKTMKQNITSLINLLILITGIAIGVLIAPRFDHRVEAAQSPIGVVPASDGSPKTTAVSPMISAGSAGFYLLLGHHIQSDELVVNGYDLLKLQNAELGLLSRFVPAPDIQKAIESSRTSEIYSVAAPPAQPVPAKPNAK